MKIEIQIDPEIKEDRIVVYTKEVTAEVQKIINSLKTNANEVITAVKDGKVYLLNPKDIIYFYAEQQKVLAKTTKEIIPVKLKLYEIEEIYGRLGFIRISNSVIANINKINNLDMNFNGTICIKFQNGDIEYSSRRYVKKIKDYLSI